MSIRDHIATDLVVSPLGADAREMIDVARCAEDAGYDGVWTLDHFSGTMLDRPWSRELFALLGGFAVATSEIRIGSLVANMVNRHPSLLASAASTLQSMTGGRAVLGVGSGAAPGSRFAAEQDAIGRELGDGSARRRHLRETVEAVRSIWEGRPDFDGEFVQHDGLAGVVGPEPIPPIVIGASGPLTIALACEIADGVNIRVSESTGELITRARSLAAGRAFELSVHDSLLLDHHAGGEVDAWVDLGVHRRTLTVVPPFDLHAIATIGAQLTA